MYSCPNIQRPFLSLEQFCRYSVLLITPLCGNRGGAGAVELQWRGLDDTTSDRQLSGLAGEEGVDIASTLATLVDAPDNEGLTTTTVTSSENTWEVGVVFASRGLDVLARVKLNDIVHDTLLGTKETHGEQDEVGREELLAAVNVLHVPATRSGLGPLDTDSVDALNVAIAIVHEVLGHDAVLTRVLAHVCLDLVVAVVCAEDTRPLWPWVVAGTLWRRLWQKLEVDN